VAAIVGSPSTGAAQSSGPPPFAIPSAGVAAGEVAVVSASTRQSVERALLDWKASDGGKEYHPTLTYMKGRPVLMLITSNLEHAARKQHRRGAIVQACGYLLDVPAFDRAVICVVEVDPEKPDQQRVRNHAVERGSFASAARKATKVDDVKDALRKAKSESGHADKICADLGID